MTLQTALAEPIALYVHVPFCLQKCPYCAFYKERYQSDQVGGYLAAIREECEAYKSLDVPLQIHSIFLGGGTPNALAPDDLDELLSILSSSFIPTHEGIERTSELNPDAVTSEQLSVFKAHGFNRFSLGIQSFQPEILSFLGRTHRAETAIKSVELIQKEVTDNINIDLIFSTPISTSDHLQKDLKQTLALNPTHVSTYALTIEDGTPFYKRGVMALSDETELTHYDQIQNQLTASGFEHYEVSAFAKPGFQSVHNLSYWQLTPYIGLGPSASSYLHRHYQNPASLQIYCEDPTKIPNDSFQQAPDPKDQLEIDFWLTNLRLREGVHKSTYLTRFGDTAMAAYQPAIDRLIKRGWLEESATHIRATDSGLALLNTLLVELVE